ncbi:MAG TPA: hypothetical protein ENK62_04850 [Chromatiales bacterium]|nr:hypothetical protein [Chromatiales bacterium]
MRVWALALLFLLHPAWGADPVDGVHVDRVVVHKAAREMLLLSGERVVRRYPISLGPHPLGPKEREGDGRTPEGRYVLDWKHPDSRYHKAIHISYPNAEDRRRAREAGVSPGGDIMIHGLPEGVGRLIYWKKGRDWTNGCIAVSNEAMDEIWALVPVNTPIEILP